MVRGDLLMRNIENTPSRLRDLFDRALDAPHGAPREAFIEAQAAGDRAALRRLLAAYAGRGFLDTPAIEHAARMATDDVARDGPIGQRIGAVNCPVAH
jgi:hypothetical protein